MRWIHISNLGFGIDTPGIEEMRNRFFKLADRIPQVDCLFVTGNIRYSKVRNPGENPGDDWEKATEYLLSLQERFQISKEKTFLVPGNQDVKRNTILRYAVEAECRRYRTNNGIIDMDVLAVVQNSRQDFLNLYKAVCGREEPGFDYVTPLDGFNIICLNTAILSDGEIEPGNLVVGGSLLNRMSKSVEKNNRPGIALACHGFPLLRREEAEGLENTLKDMGAVLYLCGTTSVSLAHTQMEVRNDQPLQVFANNRMRGPFGVPAQMDLYIGEISPDGNGHAQGYAWSDRVRAWLPDVELYSTTAKFASHPPPKQGGVVIGGKTLTLSSISYLQEELDGKYYFPRKRERPTVNLSKITHSNEADSAANVTKAKKKVSWLHLSDLHVVPEGQREFILEDFESLASKIHPDFLIVTGDFRNIKADSGFEKAEEYLKQILKIFSLKPKDVILVPGNHDADLNTTGREDAIKEIVEKTKKGDANAYATYLSGSSFNLYSAFSKFKEFTNRFYAGSGADAKLQYTPEQAHNVVWNGKLNVLCVNTALISDGKRGHREILAYTELVTCASDLKKECPTILIGHHSLDDLYPVCAEQVKSVIQRRGISAYLHGDVHKLEGKFISSLNLGDDKPVPSFACGKSVPQSGDNNAQVGVIYYKWVPVPDGKTTVRVYEWKNAKGFLPSSEGYVGIDQPYSFEMRKTK